MPTTGSYDLDLNNIGDATNNSIGVVEKVTEELANRGDLIGLGIAISVSLVLIFGAVMVAISLVPRLIKGVKNIK